MAALLVMPAVSGPNLAQAQGKPIFVQPKTPPAPSPDQNIPDISGALEDPLPPLPLQGTCTPELKKLTASYRNFERAYSKIDNIADQQKLDAEMQSILSDPIRSEMMVRAMILCGFDG